MALKFWESKERVEALRSKIDQADNDVDRRRIHAHGIIDAKLEDGEITWQEAQAQKDAWDSRHGY